MARFRLKRFLLWGLLFLPVLAVPAAYLLGRAWVNRHLQRDFSFGKVEIHLAAPRLGWDLEFTADSLRVVSPDFRAGAGKLHAELRFWQSLVSLSPSFTAGMDTLRVELPERAERKGPRVLRLRNKKPASFPPLRFPVPFRVEAERVEVSRSGRPVAAVSRLAAYSQGPKGAAVEWDSARIDTATVLDGKFRASARWFGKWVRYQARFRSSAGDELRLEGERRKGDLARGKDSLEVSVLSLEPYARLFKGGKAPGFSSLRIAASFRTDPRTQESVGLFGSRASRQDKDNRASIGAEAQVEWRMPGPMRLGPLDMKARLSFQDSAGRLSAEVKGVEGGSARLQGQFTVPLRDSLEPAEAARALEGTFSGFSRDVRMPIGKRVLPGDFEIRRLRVAGGEGRAEVRSRDGTDLEVRIFKDSGGADTPGWRFTFRGQASPTETWARAWTDTNVNYKSATVTGEFRPGELEVEVRGKGVTAYAAAADSLWARNIIRKRGYYLDDSRLYYKGLVWPVKGEVEWTERRPVKGPRGLRLRREVRLSFRAAHAEHGRLEFTMPRRGSMVVAADSLAAEYLPVPKVEKAVAFHPDVTGRFAWDWKERIGEAGVHAAFQYGGRKLGLDLEAGWDPQLLKVPVLELAMEDSRLRLGAELRLRGRQFHQAGKSGLDDIKGLALEASRFEAAHLAALFPGIPLEGGTLNGRLSYDDTTGFRGHYGVEGLQLKPLRKHMEIPALSLTGNGRDLVIAARTSSQKYPFLNDTLSLKAMNLLGKSPGVSLKASSAGGLTIAFDGGIPDFKALHGSFSAEGALSLPGGAGTVSGFKLTGSMAAPLDKSFLARLKVDSAVVEGRYAVQGLDTQTFRGEVDLREGRLVVPYLRASDPSGRTLSGEAEARLGKPLILTAKVKGEALSLQVQSFQKLAFKDIEATVRADSSGMSAVARAGGASFQSKRGAVASSGDLENLYLTFAKARTGTGGREPIAKVGVKARLRNFNLKHKIGFRDIQRNIRTVKVDKRRKRIKPVDLDVSLEAVGAENRVETDILRMFFIGDVAMKGVYPYTLFNGEVSALSGEVGQTSQSYDIQDFALKWQNATMEEGRIQVEGAKKLKVDCRPETQRTCNVFVRLDGRLDEMAFTYDTDCGQTASGEALEPAALITSVSRGCYSGDYVSGAEGGGGYGEAMFTFLEPTISENLTKRVSQASGGWIKTTQVSGIGAVVAKDTTANSQPIAVSVETKEWKGVKGMASTGYHPEKTVNNPWQNKVAVEWRLPLEKVAADSGWKRRVRDRVTLEASAETRPEERLEEQEEREVRRQVGLRYRFKFWKLW